MGKLFNLKEWLTVADAARHLTIVFGEEVTEADVLRLGLDERLRLSIRFVNDVPAKLGTVGERKYSTEVESLTRALCEKFGKPFDDKVFYTTSIRLLPKGTAKERMYFNCEHTTWIRGVWDLPMIGDEKREIEHRYQMLTDGPAITGVEHEYGAFVGSINGAMARLVEKGVDDSGIPMFGFPDDGVIVVRTEALRELEASLNTTSTSPEKPLNPNERNSLLTIIAALCDHASIGRQERGAAARIVRMVETIGARIDEDTVRRALVKIPDAMESRMK